MQQVKREESGAGWVFQAVVSRAAFRRVPPSGKPYFTVMSLHTNNYYATRREIAKNVLFPIRTVACQEQVDVVAGDLHGAAWRKKSGDIQQRDSTIEEAFANTNLPIPHGPKPLLGPGGAPGERADVC